jgi:hypothetical protein
MQRFSNLYHVVAAVLAAGAMETTRAADFEPRPLVRPAAAAETLIAEALDRGTRLSGAERAKLLEQTARKALATEPNNIDVGRILRRSLVTAAQSPSEALIAPALETALRDALEILAFRPVMEAPLPDGFPPPTPLGQIEIKKYPVYRLARTNMNGRSDEGRAFFTLFEHISTNNIAMTAPVELTFSSGRSSRPGEQAMAFLYKDLQIGRTGKKGDVTVEDVPERMVVSLGVRGQWNADRVAEAEKSLQDWLRARGEYEAVGPLRVMGYNSPMIPEARRFAEVQLPVKPRQPQQNTPNGF